MKKHKNKIIAGVVIAIVLAFVFWYGGDAPGLRGWQPEKKEDVTVARKDEPTKEKVTKAEKPVNDIQVNEEKVTGVEEISGAKKIISDIPIKTENAPVTEENKPQNQDVTVETSAEKIAVTEEMPESVQPATEGQEQSAIEETESYEIRQGNQEYSENQGMVINVVTGKDKYRTEPVVEGNPVPIEPENAVITDKELTCTLSVRCDAIFQNIGWLDSAKVDIIPEDGVIFAEKTVTFYEGESVFNVLVREMKRNKIHMEFENTPIYNSAYIEGIANIYEFDCGELSGWMYKVNDWFPNYGCSRYQLKAGDRIEWVYTCDSGNDVGGQYSARNGN